MMIQRILLIFALSLASLNSFAKSKYGNFEKLVKISGGHELKVVYRYNGEPIARPRAFSMWVKCKREKEYIPVGEYQMCALSNYEIDVKANKVIVDYVDARVEPTTGVATCDQRGHGDLSLDGLCK